MQMAQERARNVRAGGAWAGSQIRQANLIASGPTQRIPYGPVSAKCSPTVNEFGAVCERSVSALPAIRDIVKRVVEAQ